MNNNPNNKTKHAEDQLKLNEKYNTNDLFNSSLARKHGWNYISDVSIDETKDIIQDERQKVLKPKKRPMRVNKVRFKKKPNIYRHPTTPASVKVDDDIVQITTAILTINLDGKINDFYKSNTFIREFTEDIANAAGVSPDRIRIFSVSEGSIIVEFEILPPHQYNVAIKAVYVADIAKLEIQAEGLRVRAAEVQDAGGIGIETLRTEIAKIQNMIVHKKQNKVFIEPTVNMVIANLKNQINKNSSKLRKGKHTRMVNINIPLKVKKITRLVKIDTPKHKHSHIKKIKPKTTKKITHPDIHSHSTKKIHTTPSKQITSHLHIHNKKTKEFIHKIPIQNHIHDHKKSAYKDISPIITSDHIHRHKYKQSEKTTSAADVKKHMHTHKKYDVAILDQDIHEHVHKHNKTKQLRPSKLEIKYDHIHDHDIKQKYTTKKTKSIHPHYHDHDKTKITYKKGIKYTHLHDHHQRDSAYTSTVTEPTHRHFHDHEKKTDIVKVDATQFHIHDHQKKR